MAVNTLKRSNSSQELDLPEICGIPEEYSLDIACALVLSFSLFLYDLLSR